MRSRRFIIPLLTGLALGVGVGAFAYSALGAPEEPVFGSTHSDFSVAGAAAFPDFPLYAVGQRFEGLSLTGITRRLDAPVPPDPTRANFVAFRYGDCAPLDGEGCPAPLELQVWPACERTFSSYSLTPAGDPLPHQRLKVRGVPAAFFEGGRRLELYTGSVSVVMFGQGRAQLLRAAEALQGVNGAGVESGEPLPLPVHGALEGRLAC